MTCGLTRLCSTSQRLKGTRDVAGLETEGKKDGDRHLEQEQEIQKHRLG